MNKSAMIYFISGLTQRHYIKTYAEPSYLVGAVSSGMLRKRELPLQVVYKLIFCVSPDNFIFCVSPDLDIFIKSTCSLFNISYNCKIQ